MGIFASAKGELEIQRGFKVSHDSLDSRDMSMIPEKAELGYLVDRI
jgi:hypothetical protein